ncbi:MAG: imidazolonepropionase [Candidatus Dormibacteria bacterium]
MRALRNVGRLISPGSEPRQRVDVLLDDEVVAAVVPAGQGGAVEEEFDCQGGLLTPGLIDAHTHPVYARPRLEEIALRSAGVSYSEIAAAGGGINATVRDTRATPLAELEADARARLRRWLEQGTTTVEAKTGYWLAREGELGAVGLLARLAGDPSLPRLTVTYLAAHEVPPERRGERADYVAAVAKWCPAARAAGASFCDVFCDQGAFTVAESELILRAGAAAGMRLRLHADELQLTGGALLAARLGAISADHLLQIGEREIQALKESGTVATLCPVTALTMGKLPPARGLLRAGVSLALGSDHNPGTSGITSMSLVVYLAITEFGLSVGEALTAATSGGADSLGVRNRGAVEPGMLADLVLWEADHEGAFAWEPGLRAIRVWRGGALLPVEPEHSGSAGHLQLGWR